MYFSHFVLISAQIGFGGFACFVTTDFRLLAVGKKKKILSTQIQTRFKAFVKIPRKQKKKR